MGLGNIRGFSGSCHVFHIAPGENYQGDAGFLSSMWVSAELFILLITIVPLCESLFKRLILNSADFFFFFLLRILPHLKVTVKVLKLLTSVYLRLTSQLNDQSYERETSAYTAPWLRAEFKGGFGLLP